MGATTSQCCAVCNDNCLLEVVEASSSVPVRGQPTVDVPVPASGSTHELGSGGVLLDRARRPSDKPPLRPAAAGPKLESLTSGRWDAQAAQKQGAAPPGSLEAASTGVCSPEACASPQTRPQPALPDSTLQAARGLTQDACPVAKACADAEGREEGNTPTAGTSSPQSLAEGTFSDVTELSPPTLLAPPDTLAETGASISLAPGKELFEAGSPCCQPEEEEEDSPLPGPEAEDWASFAKRAAARLHKASIPDTPSSLWDVFQSTDDLGLTFASFAALYSAALRQAGDAAQAPWAGPSEAPGKSCRYPFQLIQRLLGSNWKAQKLWKLLAERAGRPEYVEAPCSRGRLEGRRCLVVGAGPCGLRAAIELRLLGAQVIVAEQRVRFTRINQLHIWSWCGEDLKGLGARTIEPPPKDFGSNPDLLVIAINDLQKFLLKIALLLGVEVRLGVSYSGVHWGPDGWCTELHAASRSLSTEGRAGTETSTNPFMSFAARGILPPSHFAPGSLGRLAAVIGSGGFASEVGEQVGMKMVETESLRKESAIGLICNIARTNGKAEADLRSYSMARQFYTAMFKKAAKETGADLENIVYVKAPASHYFVMTPTPKSLVSSGVVINDGHRPMLDARNISEQKLDELVRRVLSFRFKEGEPTLMEAVSKDLGGEGRFPGYADSGPRLFDFSRMRRSAEGLLLMPPAQAGEDAESGSLLVALAGDSLMEPFWPEGLGIVRGFFSALDACHAVQRWAAGASGAEAQEEYAAAFQKLKTLSAATRARVLRDDERKFALDPKTRYR